MIDLHPFLVLTFQNVDFQNEIPSLFTRYVVKFHFIVTYKRSLTTSTKKNLIYLSNRW